ncbi:hypothetical protein B0H17DRAFT_938383, partial [Mycena rosella]
VGWTQSLTAISRSSWLNVLLIFVPVAWGLHSVQTIYISHTLEFSLCFIAIVPLCKLLDYGGALYCGKDIGDLVLATLNNAVRSRPYFPICLVVKCQLRLLQSTIVGVVLLRLLLVPACAFTTGGARIAAQELHLHLSGLNQTLLTTGVLSLVLPAAFFAALNSSDPARSTQNVVSDDVRGDILKVSRGLAVILLAVYLCSRIFLHNPPGTDNGPYEHKDALAELKELVEKMAEEEPEPEVNLWACLILLVFTVGLMAVTAEFVISIEPMQESLEIKEESVLLFLLSSPIVILVFTGGSASSCSHSSRRRVVLLVSATFLVNYVTAEAKTNWVEGVMMLALYSMIASTALTAWFYPGQPAVRTMLSCTSVQEALASQGVPPNSTYTNVSFAGFHATLDDSQISNFTDRLTDRLRDLQKL